VKIACIAFATGLVALMMTGCGGKNESPVAIVDTDRLLQYWPKFQNYNNQFSVDLATVDRSRAPENQKAKQRFALQAKYAQVQRELTDEVRGAATAVAKERHFQLIVTHQYVAYGGIDITPDVEKALKITEPPPSAKP